MDFIWECMSISMRGFLGMVFWTIGIGLFSFAIAVLGFALSGEWKKNKKPRPKYKGKKIIIQGGKKDE